MCFLLQNIFDLAHISLLHPHIHVETLPHANHSITDRTMARTKDNNKRERRVKDHKHPRDIAQHGDSAGRAADADGSVVAVSVQTLSRT